MHDGGGDDRRHKLATMACWAKGRSKYGVLRTPQVVPFPLQGVRGLIRFLSLPANPRERPWEAMKLPGLAPQQQRVEITTIDSRAVRAAELLQER